MIRKIVWAAAGLAFVATPLAVFAQSSTLTDSCSSNQTIQCLQQEILILTKLLEELLSRSIGHSAASVTIDQNSLTENTGTFSITGESSGQVITDGIQVLLILSSYTGPTDYQSVGGQLDNDGGYQSLSAGVWPSGKWDAQFSSITTGSYSVLVYDDKSKALLARGTLTVTNSGNAGPASATITSPLTQSPGSFTMSGTAQNTSDVVVSIFTPDESGQFFGSGGLPVVNGAWSVTVPALAAGSYLVTVTNGQPIPAGQPIPTDNTLTTANLLVSGQSAATSLTASNPNPVQYSIVAGGTTGVAVGSFALQASGEDMNVQQIGLYLAAQQASPGDVVHAYVYEGSTLMGTVQFTGTPSSNCPPANSSLGRTGGCYYATTTIAASPNVNPRLPENSAVNFTVKADIANIGAGQSGTSGDLVLVGLSDAIANGVNSATNYQSGYAPDMTGVRMFKSYPTVTSLPVSSALTSSVGAPVTLLRFGVQASSNGSISLGNTLFSVAASQGLTFSKIAVYGFIDSGFIHPVSIYPQGLMFTCTGSCQGKNSFVTGAGSSGFVIPAGSTDYFEVVGIPATLPGSGSFAVTTTLLGDGSYQPLTTYAADNTSNNFEWSPNDNASVSSNANTSSDWTNGFGVAGLPIAGIQQVVTGQGVATSSPLITPPTPATPQTCSLTASPSTIQQGQTATLSWVTSIKSPTSVTLTLPNDLGSFNELGKTSFQSNNAGTFNLVVTDASGNTATCSATLAQATPAPAPACSESFSPSTVVAGQPYTDTWSSTNASSMTLVATLLGKAVLGPGPTGVNGTYQNSYATPGTYNYTRTVTGAGGTGQCTASLVVTPPAPTCSMSATPGAAGNGQNATISWTTSVQNPSALSLALPDGLGTFNETGRTSFTAGQGGTYTLTVTDSSGNTGTCSLEIASLSPQAAGPTVSLTANGVANLPYTSPYTVAWSSSNASSCTLSWQGSGTQASQQGSQNITPNAAGSGQSGLLGSYTFTCVDSSGRSSSQSANTYLPQSSATDQSAQLASALAGLQAALQNLEKLLAGL